jgi:hypothetical protein
MRKDPFRPPPVPGTVAPASIAGRVSDPRHTTDSPVFSAAILTLLQPSTNHSPNTPLLRLPTRMYLFLAGIC